jgi:hypothetical protein
MLQLFDYKVCKKYMTRSDVRNYTFVMPVIDIFFPIQKSLFIAPQLNQDKNINNIIKSYLIEIVDIEYNSLEPLSDRNNYAIECKISESNKKNYSLIKL